MSDFSIVSVYEIASDINNQFHRLTNIYGKDNFFVLMKMVLKVLEMLEEQAIKLDHENAEINDLKFTIERLQLERKIKADENIKFQKECEQIDESWQNEVQSKVKRIEVLEKDLKKLKKLISTNRDFYETEVKESDSLTEIQFLYKESGRLKQQVKQASDRINLLTCDCEMKEKEMNFVKEQRDELKKKLCEMSDKFQKMMLDRDLWMTQCQETLYQLKKFDENDFLIQKEVNLDEKGAQLKSMKQNKLSINNEIKSFCESYWEKNTKNEENNDVQGPINKEPDAKRDLPMKTSKISDFFSHLINWPKTKGIQACQFMQKNAVLNKQRKDSEGMEFFENEKSSSFYFECKDFDTNSNMISSIKSRVDQSNQDITCISSNSRSPTNFLIENISQLDDPSHLNNPSTLQSVFYNSIIFSDVPFHVSTISHIK